MGMLAQNVAYRRMYYLGQTSLTPTFQLSKACGAFQNPAIGAASATEVGGGWYFFDLQAADTDTLGELAYSFGSGIMNAEFHDQVLPTLPGADPWLAPLPGAYTPGQAGFMVGTGLSTTVGVLPATANDAIAAEVLDKANGIETALTVKQALRLVVAALAGKVAISGATVTIKGAGVNTDRIAATTDSAGQRTAVILTP
jgi:hypothetical protein